MTSPVYTQDQLNYFRICHIVTTILPQGLRSFFKQEWDRRYRAKLGEWNDTPQNGLDFYNGESPRSQIRNARLLETIRNENRAKWDCTTLFFAVLYSNSIGHGLGAAVRLKVNDLREFRNEKFAHMPQGQLSDKVFRDAARKVEIVFQFLGLSTTEIQNIYKQESFPTEELRCVRDNVQSLRQELRVANSDLRTSEEQRRSLVKRHQFLGEQHHILLQQNQVLDQKHQVLEEQHHILEEQLHSEVLSFCILPAAPLHEIASRESEVGKITKQLERLKEANENGLSYLYISGNPGSGKSQLARMVAQKFYEAVNGDPKTPTFVMTLNAESTKTLLESYASLARRTKCPEYTVMCTLNSTEMQFSEKIDKLNDLITTKIALYGSWLLVIDNVTSLSDIHDFLPGNGQWKKGQLLITTQNTSSIPSESSSVSHISVSVGMAPADACCFLAEVSGIRQQGAEDKVTKALDYQPLALASAGVYVKKIRESKSGGNFGWKEYLGKLNRGLRTLTEKELTQTNQSYRKSMTVATRMAIEGVINVDSVVKSTFTFLSFCSPQPLHIDIVTNYILNEEKHLEREEVARQIQGYSLLMFEERQNEVFVKVHQVVHEVSKSVINAECREPDEHVQVVTLAVKSFNQFLDTPFPRTWNDLDSKSDSKHLIPHLNLFAVEVEKIFLHKDKFQVFKEGFSKDSNVVKYFRRLGEICWNHREFVSAKRFCDSALKVVEMNEGFIGIDHADIYSLLGMILLKMGELQHAKENCERALKIKQKDLEPEHVDLVNTYNCLGLVQRKMGDLQNAKENHERALDIQLKHLGPKHVDLVITYLHLGNVQFESGDLKQAIEYYNRTLNIQVENLGQDHISVAFSLFTMGTVQSKLGDLPQAKQYYEKALTIWSKKLGPEHVNVARTYSGLAKVQRNLGDLSQAKKYCELALNIEMKKLGPEHVDVAVAYSNLADVHWKLGDLQEAKDYYERALNILLENFGHKLVDVAYIYHNLANVLYDLDDLQQAKVCYESALEIKLEKLGPEHVDVAPTYSSLSNVQRDLGDLHKAKECCERALNIRQEKLGLEHVDVQRTRDRLRILQSELDGLQRGRESHARKKRCAIS